MSKVEAPHPGQLEKKTGKSYQGGGPTLNFFPGNNFKSLSEERGCGYSNPQLRHTRVMWSQSGDNHTANNCFMVAGANSGNRQQPPKSSRNQQT
jgi:hypothetical protein